MSTPRSTLLLRWASLPRWAQLSTGAYLLAFTIATCSHIIDIAVLGPSVYQEAPGALRWYFIGLVILDPIVVLLVLALRGSGLILAIAVITTDVAGNVFMASIEPGWPLPVTQTFFGVFILATAMPLRREFRAARRTTLQRCS